MPAFTIARADPEAARGLLEASHALMESLFPPEENHYLSLAALRAPHITFLVARGADGAVLGCGALALQDGYGELKSMFTDPAARGQGIADALIDALQDVARAAGVPVLRLETGTLLHAAHRLYARKGFTPRGPFGNYPAGGSSLFMEKPL